MLGLFGGCFLSVHQGYHLHLYFLKACAFIITLRVLIIDSDGLKLRIMTPVF